ncbi:unnamed protein product [Ectocarpus sp. 13 AM-2016]
MESLCLRFKRLGNKHLLVDKGLGAATCFWEYYLRSWET